MHVVCSFGFRCLLGSFFVFLSGVFADSLQPLGDEFDDAASLSQWMRVYEVEGSVANQLEGWDINTTTNGSMMMMPHTSTWFGNLRGVLVFKEVMGDFVVTARLRVQSRHNAADPNEVPNRSFTLAGIMVREPTGFVQVAPVPYTEAAVLPGSLGSDWLAGSEDYLFLSYGTGGNPGTRQYEVKTTDNSSSTLYYRNRGVPDSTEVTLQFVRVGSTFVVMRRHPGGSWIVENRYVRVDMPAMLQVGITTYTDWPNMSPNYFPSVEGQFHHNYLLIDDPLANDPDLIANVEYVRFQRPSTNLTEVMLGALDVDFSANGVSVETVPLAVLPATGAGAFLGDVANVELGSVALQSALVEGNEADGSVVLHVERSGASTHLALSMQVVCFSGTATVGVDFVAATGVVVWAEDDVASKEVSVPLIADTLAEGPEVFQVVFFELDGPATFVASVSAITATVTILDHPLAQWRLDEFGVAANSSEGALSGDFDLDGDVNMVELALGSSATNGAEHSSLFVDHSGGQGFIRFTPMVLAVDFLDLRVEASEDLLGPLGWTSVVTHAGGDAEWLVLDADFVVSTNGATGEITVLDESETVPARYLRFGVQEL